MSRDDRYDPTPLRGLRPPFLQYPIDAHEPYPSAQLPLPAHDIIAPPAPPPPPYGAVRERALPDFPPPPDHVDGVAQPHALPPDPQPLQAHHVHALPHSLSHTDHAPPVPMSHPIAPPLPMADGATGGGMHHGLGSGGGAALGGGGGGGGGGGSLPSHHDLPPPAPPFQPAMDNALAAEYPNFASLVSSISRHPSLVLLFKRVFAATGMQPFDADAQLAESVLCGERKIDTVRHCAEVSGLHRAVAQFSAVEVMLSALLTALSEVRCGFGALGNPALRQALDSVCNSQQHQQRLGAVNMGVGGGSARAMGVWRDERSIQKGVGSGRTPLSEKAKQALERWFHENLENPYPTIEQKLELARVCSMSLNSVNNWFGNKRMRIKRKMLNVASGPFDGGSISDKVLAPRSKWRAVVVSKMNGRAGREVVASATGRAGGGYGTEESGMGGGGAFGVAGGVVRGVGVGGTAVGSTSGMVGGLMVGIDGVGTASAAAASKGVSQGRLENV